MFPNNIFSNEFLQNKMNIKPNYSLNLQKILLPKVRNIAIAFFVLFLLGAPPGKSFMFSNGLLVVILFPLILCLSVFAGNWFVQILDIIFLWVKSIDFETKTINKRIKYDDIYLLEYDYQFTERHKRTVFALLIITTEKKAKFKILAEAESFSDTSDECKELIKYCQEQNKYMLVGNRRFPTKRKIIIGRKNYVNWSYYQRIFVGNILWMLTAVLFMFLGICLALRENIFNS